MERRHGYKGFVIEAHPYELGENLGWKAEVCIEKHDGSGINDNLFFLSTIFPSKDEAITGAVEAGKSKIDAGFRAAAASEPVSV
jgi:hypothetical protein